MDVVIMAGGRGSRMRPLTDRRPKPLLPVLGKPLLGYICDHLSACETRRVTVTVGYQADAVRTYLGTGASRGIKVRYAEEHEPLGTAGGVRNAARFLDGPFAVMSGDALTDVDLAAAAQYHRRHGGLATLVLSEVEDPRHYGVVQLAADGQITDFVEKPDPGAAAGNLVNTGIYIFEPDVLDHIPPHQFFDFARDLFPRLMEQGAELYGWPWDGYWADLGNIRQYQESHWDLLDGRVALPRPAPEVRPGVFVEDGVAFPDQAVEPPVYLGRGSTLAQGATVGPYAVLGPQCRIQGQASLRRTILFGGVTVGPGAVLEQIVSDREARVDANVELTRGVVVGAGSQLTAVAGSVS